MPEAEELEAARRLVTLALLELSRHDVSSSTSPPCGLPALLHRCLQLLPLLNAGDPSLAARCCRGLLASLGAILSRNPSPSLLPSLEVVVENLVFSERLRSYLAMADCAAPEGSRIFTKALPYQGVHHLTLELVCCHFISSLQDEGGFEAFLSALSWSWNESWGTPEISFLGALALIHRTCMFSLPVVVQAHLLLLASRCIRDQNLDKHLHAFEHAMNLYVRYLPALDVFNRTGGMKIPWSSSVNRRPLGCCIKNATDQKLKSQIDGLRSFCQLHSGDDLPTNESDIDRLIEENQHILHENFRQESTVVLKGILSNILFCAKQEGVLPSDTELSDGIICLAAVLRVMSSSLLHILHCFSQMRSASDKTNVNYTTLCNSKEYKVICEIICLLGQHEANELHRYNLLDITGMPVNRERASVLMLAHFATLSICCLRRRVGFLWKRCVVMMIMSVNLIAEEEGLGTFQLSTDVSKVSAVFCNTEERTLEVSERAKEIASRYETIYKFLKGRHIDGDGSSLVTSQKRKSGKAFLECLPGYSPDWDDLEDFVDCEEGKDYENTLKQQRKFKEFKCGKWCSKRQSNLGSTASILGLRSRRLFSKRPSYLGSIARGLRSRRLCS